MKYSSILMPCPCTSSPGVLHYIAKLGVQADIPIIVLSAAPLLNFPLQLLQKFNKLANQSLLLEFNPYKKSRFSILAGLMLN